MDEPKERHLVPSEGEALVAHNLKIMRKTARLSQDDVAERMRRLGFKFHQTQIAKIENGTRAIQFDEVIGLAKALNLPAEYFMTQAVADPHDFHFELQEAGFRLQDREKEWRTAQDLADAARGRLEEAEREYDEIAERLGVDTAPSGDGLTFYPAPNSPEDPLRKDEGTPAAE
ncbi:helix-turn-helix transcriptional regulator [Streptomyces sp. H10-C2]|uniref:helix-turn-helix domain-containing protein n=1 Tax=unclassified Streptomyces TaxID=2593676 RepID=UPI0024B94666|nr:MULTISPECIES: helix-turn-helix transcriptional regulator [unclassified Streptomyces]MDJ0342601.1 helix-turn-helix transcriptional regulator [Streptomyces sp. PH10-H1]MDJ0368545.1 helix-turn-helix transcriptional regulator [Streptomyces sp. H10-C2]